MRFLIDAQLPPGLAKLFRAAGHEARHVVDVGLLMASDHEIAAYASDSQMIVVTKDEDFAVMRQFSANAPRVVWLRIGNTTARALVARLRLQMKEILAALADREEIVEVR